MKLRQKVVLSNRCFLPSKKLLMEEILHQLVGIIYNLSIIFRLVSFDGKNPANHLDMVNFPWFETRFHTNVRWLFGISEPSTVCDLHFLGRILGRTDVEEIFRDWFPSHVFFWKIAWYENHEKQQLNGMVPGRFAVFYWMNATFQPFPTYKDVESSHPPGSFAVFVTFLGWWVSLRDPFNQWKGWLVVGDLQRLGIERSRLGHHLVNIHYPGTQMTPILIGKDLVLEGWSPKTEDKQVPGLYMISMADGLIFLPPSLVSCLTRLHRWMLDLHLPREHKSHHNREAWSNWSMIVRVRPSWVRKMAPVRKQSAPGDSSRDLFIPQLEVT